MARKSLKNATIKMLDGTAVTPNEVTVELGTGNVTWTENYAYEYEAERGSIGSGTVRDADETPVEVSVTATWENTYYHAGDTVLHTDTCTPYEALKQVGAAAAWVSTGADPCEPYACILKIEFDVDCGSSGVEDEITEFTEFRCESCAFDISAGTLVFSGKSKEVRPVTTRTAIV